MKFLAFYKLWDWLQIRNCYDFTPKKENSWIRLRTTGKETTLTIKEIQDKTIEGTKELEIVVSDFATTDELLNKLGYFARSVQENRRIRYMLNGVELDIDSWPYIPTYLEIEGTSEEAVYKTLELLGIEKEATTTRDVEGIYLDYGHNLDEIYDLKLEEDRK